MTNVAGLPSTDVVTASGDKVSVVTIGHASLLFLFQAHYIYVDPWSKMTSYAKLPKGDVILITHSHYDHLDVEAITAAVTKIQL
jgi:L-ascorbate metabolism protein UlaG (beta-lactamase superfamily)